MSWTGTVRVKVTGEFTYEVTKDWQADDEADAKDQVETELVAYLGNAYVDERFTEEWTIQPDTEMEAKLMFAVVVESDDGDPDVLIFGSEAEAESFATHLKDKLEPHEEDLEAWEFYPRVKKVSTVEEVVAKVEDRLQAYFGAR